MNELVIADLQISEISDAELEDAFRRVIIGHKDAVESIQQSMKDADEVYRKYLIEDYEPLEETARADRALLNKAEKNIAEKYASLKEAYERPLQNLEMNIKAIRNALKNASDLVGNAVNTHEEKRKAKKRDEILTYWNSKKFDLVLLDRIFDDRWLNKGFKIPDILEQIDKTISGIYRNIEILERIPGQGIAAKAFYLETLDMSAALKQVDVLKENAERLIKEQETREERKTKEQIDINAVNEHREKIDTEEAESNSSLIDQAFDLPAGTTAIQAREEIIEQTLTFKGTKDRLLKLREFMTANGISYNKGLVFNTDREAAVLMKHRGFDSKIYSFIYVPAA